MSRIPHAARVLIGQAVSEYPLTQWHPVSEPDGFGVVRTIRFSKTTGDWLGPLLDAIDDPRIVDLDHRATGLFVTFAPGIVADFREKFPLDAAILVNNGLTGSAVPAAGEVDEVDDPLTSDETP